MWIGARSPTGAPHALSVHNDACSMHMQRMCSRTRPAVGEGGQEGVGWAPDGSTGAGATESTSVKRCTSARERPPHAKRRQRASGGTAGGSPVHRCSCMARPCCRRRMMVGAAAPAGARLLLLACLLTAGAVWVRSHGQQLMQLCHERDQHDNTAMQCTPTCPAHAPLMPRSCPARAPPLSLPPPPDAPYTRSRPGRTAPSWPAPTTTGSARCRRATCLGQLWTPTLAWWAAPLPPGLPLTRPPKTCAQYTAGTGWGW